MLSTLGNQNTVYSGSRELKKNIRGTGTRAAWRVFPEHENLGERGHVKCLSPAAFTAERVARPNLDPMIFRF